MKKICAMLLMLSLCFVPVCGFENAVFEPILDIPVSGEARQYPTLSLDARCAALYEVNTGELLYEKNADERVPIASVTKIMTMLLVFEALERGEIKLGDTVTASSQASELGGSQIWLEPGENMTVEELLRAVAIGSANDAAGALAEHIGGSISGFVAMMNARAAELKMENTHFSNPHGLDESEHFSSAHDVAVMSIELLKYDIENYSTVWMDELRGGETQLVNTNKLLKSYEGITGLKTGTTDDAGFCLAASARRQDSHFLAVVLGGSTSEGRFSAARTLLDYAFGSFEAVRFTIEAPPENIRVVLGEYERVKVGCEHPEWLLTERGKGSEVGYTVEISESIHAPVKQGQTVGRIVITVGGVQTASCEIKALSEVKKLDFGIAMGKFFDALFAKSVKNS